MKKLLKEVLWIIGSYIVLATIKNIFFPLDNPKYPKEVFINVSSDNYFITNLEVFFSILIVGYFIIYQIRSLILKFNNQSSNYILVFWHILLVTLMSISIAFSFSFKNSYALSDKPTFHINGAPYDLNWQIIIYTLIAGQMAISILLTYNTARIIKVKMEK